MKLGNVNEGNIANAMAHFMRSNSVWTGRSTGTSFTIELLEMCEVGICSRKGRPDIATSVDRVARIQVTSSSENVSRVHTVMVEIKTASTNHTVEKALRRVRQFPVGARIIFAKFGCEIFKKLIWTSDYRSQVTRASPLTHIYNYTWITPPMLIFTLMHKLTPTLKLIVHASNIPPAVHAPRRCFRCQHVRVRCGCWR